MELSAFIVMSTGAYLQVHCCNYDHCWPYTIRYMCCSLIVFSEFELKENYEKESLHECLN